MLYTTWWLSHRTCIYQIMSPIFSIPTGTDESPLAA